ncbi:unnamed protein product [Penicillium olsonii]|uniref:Uncharacterized protein n=1 Tax=Penicillium olsonii TaxID=99116 RepID=A0A9W4H9L3_PENOL|nr:unnamed protein product [Penicillium olsonii]CAG7929493.1 unnamed protein product [Penicillium olsonii]CAG7940563.1 unnamed protein product [Penicillium olsonii]CAG8190278.1 unnamed protein product [Penicillium olsonii]CAG8267113.1 unnamed protein product [Penicillium olsonii]
MASGRPPGSHPTAGRDDDLLLDSGPAYSTGQGPPVNDEHLLEQFNIDDSEQPYDQTHPRPSVSYDSFVGSRAPQHAPQHSVSGLSHPPVNPGIPPNDPYSGGMRDRSYSQTSGLDNYRRYSLDDFDDGHSGYYDLDADEDRIASSHHVRKANERNSVLGLGGGIMGKAKYMFGMGSNQYSEMDLPLTEAGARRATVDSTRLT